MFEEFKSDFKYHQFFEANNKILIADIGHYESEQFLEKILGLNFSIAHCDFSLRGKESDFDAKFTEDFAKSLNVLVLSKKI